MLRKLNTICVTKGWVLVFTLEYTIISKSRMCSRKKDTNVIRIEDICTTINLCLELKLH